MRDLNEGQYQTIGDIDRAVNRAKASVEAYEAEFPDLFKFSTDHITESSTRTANEGENRP